MPSAPPVDAEVSSPLRPPRHELLYYLPRLALRGLGPDSSRDLEPTREALVAAVLFADVRGFSALSTQLAGNGAEGVEALSDRLTGCLGHLVDIIDAFGGDVVEFAGDAVLAMWTGEDACRLAATAALQAQRTAPSGHGLSLRIGLGFGSSVFLRLGGWRGRWQHVLTGAAPRQATQAERQAKPGTICASPAFWSQLGARRERFGPLSRLTPEAERRPLPALAAAQLPPREVLAAMVPDRILTHIEAS
ncbi:MAG: adenylate/guanylate cyclase domain-containing protein, partial [Oligoflexia bacterium]|nr:adenylate/guanylate cyclase domain-containing protein [Oligoflexia bacterium]